MIRVTLPNQLKVWAPSALEAALVYREVVTESTYHADGIVLPDKAIVFDVGANVGLFAIHMARTVRGVQLHAFEPIPEQFEALRANLAEHAPGARAYNIGLSDRDGEATFEVDRFMTIAATMHPQVFDRDDVVPRAAWARAAIADIQKVDPGRALRLLEAGLETPLVRSAMLALVVPIAAVLGLRRWIFLRRLRCPVGTLSAALAASGVPHVDLVKVDVEGAEEQVLDGIADADWPRIRQLVVEVHDVDGRLDRLSQRLAALGFRTTSRRQDWALHELLGIWTLYAVRDGI